MIQKPTILEPGTSPWVMQYSCGPDEASIARLRGAVVGCINALCEKPVIFSPSHLNTGTIGFGYGTIALDCMDASHEVFARLYINPREKGRRITSPDGLHLVFSYYIGNQLVSGVYSKNALRISFPEEGVTPGDARKFFSQSFGEYFQDFFGGLLSSALMQ